MARKSGAVREEGKSLNLDALVAQARRISKEVQADQTAKKAEEWKARDEENRAASAAIAATLESWGAVDDYVQALIDEGSLVPKPEETGDKKLVSITFPRGKDEEGKSKGLPYVAREGDREALVKLFAAIAARAAIFAKLAANSAAAGKVSSGKPSMAEAFERAGGC